MQELKISEHDISEKIWYSQNGWNGWFWLLWPVKINVFWPLWLVQIDVFDQLWTVKVPYLLYANLHGGIGFYNLAPAVGHLGGLFHRPSPAKYTYVKGSKYIFQIFQNRYICKLYYLVCKLLQTLYILKRSKYAAITIYSVIVVCWCWSTGIGTWTCWGWGWFWPTMGCELTTDPYMQL